MSNINITIVANTSQARVVGAETACTAIAVMACAHWLQATPPPSPPLEPIDIMELWIRQGGALYGKLRASPSRESRDTYAHVNEVVNFASPALPIQCVPDREWSGFVSEKAMAATERFGGMVPLQIALSELLLGGDDNQAVITAVLTVGGVSIALHFDPTTGSCDLFDSHSQALHDNKAIGVHFDNRQHLIDFLLNAHFAGASVDRKSVV